MIFQLVGGMAPYHTTGRRNRAEPHTPAAAARPRACGRWVGLITSCASIETTTRTGEIKQIAEQLDLATQIDEAGGDE
jgi:hypothetical protein